MSKQLNVAIIGCGYAAVTFHAPLIQSVPGLSLVAVSSSDRAKAQASLPAIDLCDTPEQLFARADVDLVVIPTPNHVHHPLAMQALQAGKHVVVDKPFTLDTAQAHELLDTAKAQGKVLSVFHNRRWATDFLTVQKLIASGVLGRVAHYEAHFDRFRPAVRQRWRESSVPGGGLWYDLGSHLLDEALQLFGMPQAIGLDLAAQRDGAVTDDWFHCVLRYDRRLRVVLHAGALVARPGPRYAVHGTLGSYTKFGLDPQEDQLKRGLKPGDAGWGIDANEGTLVLADGDNLCESALPNEAGNYARYYIGLRDAILQGAPNPVPAEQGLQVMQLIEAGLRSATRGGVVTL
ncbi:MAG TPA: oxidoreductase [Burkholderiaceae bacterium]